MTRFGLSNRFFNVSHTQFMKLALEFRRSVEAEFGTPCDMKIDVLSRTKRYISIIDDEAQSALDESNAAARIATLDKLSDLTESLWDRAGYVELNIRPIDKTAAPDYAFANMEAKGNRPRGVSFYVQGGGMDGGYAVREEMGRQNRLMSRNDGMDGNSTNTLTSHPSYLRFISGF
jgi:hypothetical protein